VEQLSRNDFCPTAATASISTQAQIVEIADRLEAVRKEVLTIVRASEEREWHKTSMPRVICSLPVRQT